MSTATHTTHSAHTDGSGRSSRQLQDDIRHTRREMDQTLDELGERLHPRHLLDDVVEIFRGSSDSDRAQQLADTCKRAGGSAVRTIREHPLPAALIAAGVAWWIFEDARSDDDDVEWEKLDEYGRAQLQQVRAYDEDDYEPVWRQEIMPWHEAYAWEDETEEDWTQRTRSTLESLKQTLGDQAMSARQKVQHAARKVMPLTGHKQKEIHSRWANLREHSGSFVDARTGEPYDADYAAEWENLAHIAAICGTQHDREDATLNEKARETVAKLQSTLESAGSSIKETLGSMTNTLGDYGRSSGTALKDYGATAAQTGARWARQATSATSQAARSVGRGARRQGAAAQRQMTRGYEVARDAATEAVEEYPLAVGAACFGLGLIGGLLLPRTEYEDELVGEASDELKDQAKATGQEAFEKGKEVASATASAAMDEAERQGLSPERLAQKGKQVIEQTRQSVKEAMPSPESAVATARQSAEAVAREAGNTAREKIAQQTHPSKPR